MTEFTMDGYKDLETIARELEDSGFAWTIEERRVIVPLVCQKLFNRIKDLPVQPGESAESYRCRQSNELLMGISGIVYCAVDDELISEE